MGDTKPRIVWQGPNLATSIEIRCENGSIVYVMHLTDFADPENQGNRLFAIGELPDLRKEASLPIAWKHADPTEPARWIESRSEADAIAREDPSLLVFVR